MCLFIFLSNYQSFTNISVFLAKDTDGLKQRLAEFARFANDHLIMD